jgi:hypothetical protein
MRKHQEGEECLKNKCWCQAYGAYKNKDLNKDKKEQ